MSITLDDFRSRYPTREISVDGTPWSYRTAGTGSTVLLLHGMAGSADIWFQQIETLSSTHRVIAVTYPSVTSLAILRSGIEGVLTAEDIERYSVVGSSLGGYLAQYLVASSSDRITAAVFANTFPPNPVIAARSKNLATLARILPSSFVKAFLRRNVERTLVPAGDDSPLLARLLTEQYDQPDFKGQFLARYQCVVDPFEPVHPDIPVLLISADNDPLVPRELGEALRAEYPDASTYEFHGGGHFPYVNRPDEYTDVIDNFLPRTAS